LARRYHPDVGVGSSPVEFQRAREAYETLVDPERRHRYDRQLRASHAQPVLVEELMASKPFAEPLFTSRRDSIGRPKTRVTINPSSLFEDILEEFLASVDDGWLRDDWLGGRR
jgi:DnaJ-class molecular chaperone